MATRQKKQAAPAPAPEQDFSMFAVEDRPKQGNANFKGRETDPDKLELVTEMLTKFVTFANTLEDGALDGKDINITELSRGVDEDGKPKVFTPVALAITANNILENQFEDSKSDDNPEGSHPGFYVVATGRPLDEEATEKKGSNVYGQPTKLVIRMGAKPTRNKKENGEEATEANGEDASNDKE